MLYGMSHGFAPQLKYLGSRLMGKNDVISE